MRRFDELSKDFTTKFENVQFPKEPGTLYEPCEYFLRLGGKRIRPILCLMGNELFGEIAANAWEAAIAIELFHNFTLIHDDIMDKAPLRRGVETVHARFGESVALLAGDVTLVVAYDYLNRIESVHFHKIIRLFNTTARKVCEGQQIDMDFEMMELVTFAEYLRMIELKTSVLLAASIQMGSILGNASEGNQQHLYEFGKNLGLAFQIQDDYLDAFGEPGKTGKQIGGDILANKKTFLLVKAFEVSSASGRQTLQQLIASNLPDKVENMISIFTNCGVAEWARELKEEFMAKALQHLEDIAVLSSRKQPLKELVAFLIKREN